MGGSKSSARLRLTAGYVVRNVVFVKKKDSKEALRLAVSALPGAETHFSQIVLDSDVETLLARDPVGERPAALHRRSDHVLPAAKCGCRRSHLLPTVIGQRVIDAVAAKTASADGFAVA